MRAHIPFFLSMAFVAGCAGNLDNRVAQSCPASIPAPILHVGDTWRWQDEKGANHYRRYAGQTEEGLFELETRANGPRYFYDGAHTLRKVYGDGAWITQPSLDFSALGFVVLEFPLYPGKTWNSLNFGRDPRENVPLTFSHHFTVRGCESVTVPAGTFSTVVIEDFVGIVGGRGSGVVTSWYAPEVGYFVKVVHGGASHPDVWVAARDWALTSYRITPSLAATAASALSADDQPPPLSPAPPPAPALPAGTHALLPPVPTAVRAPTWSLGDEWTYRWTSPRGKGTFTRVIQDGDTVDGQPCYAMRSGTRVIYYTQADLGWVMEKVGGAVEVRATPPEQRFVWPLVVGATWEMSTHVEWPLARSTEERHWRVRVAGWETVLVPAGTFGAFHVVVTDPIGVVKHEVWYAPDVKWVVRERLQFQYGVEDRQLVKYIVLN